MKTQQHSASRIHWLQHVPFEGLGSMEPWIRNQGFSLTSTAFYAGQMPPSMDAFDWLIVMGGPMNIHEEERYEWLASEKRFVEQAIAVGKTVLGICLGAQLLADVLGARVYPGPHKEIGWFPIEKTVEAEGAPAAEFLPQRLEAFHWHGDTFDLPDGAVHLARSRACENQGFVYGQRVVGLQFHLETTPESAGDLIENCGHEIAAGGPFIQTPAAMLADSGRFERINAVMDRLLQQQTGYR